MQNFRPSVAPEDPFEILKKFKPLIYTPMVTYKPIYKKNIDFPKIEGHLMHPTACVPGVH